MMIYLLLNTEGWGGGRGSSDFVLSSSSTISVTNWSPVVVNFVFCSLLFSYRVVLCCIVQCDVFDVVSTQLGHTDTSSSSSSSSSSGEETCRPVIIKYLATRRIEGEGGGEVSFLYQRNDVAPKFCTVA